MRGLIADCESSDRTALIELCHSRGGIGDLIVVDSGSAALQQIRVNRPEVALLACELNDMSGFDVLRALNADERPATIMVARDDRYADEALSSPVSDYLTRPIAPLRLAMALKRACWSAQPEFKSAVPSKGSTRPPNRYGTSGALGQYDRLVGERAGRMHFFSPADIDYIEADSNYVKIHVGAERYINRDSLSRLSLLLKDMGFVRISRAVLLNLQRVAFAEREGGGVLAFVLNSGTRVVSSIGFRLENGAELKITRTRGARQKRTSN